MTPEKVCQILKARFGEAVTAIHVEGGHPHAVVEASRWPEVARFLRDDPALGFNMLRCVSSLDLIAENKLAAVYDLVSMRPGERSDALWACEGLFAVRIEVDRDDPHIPTVSDVWPTAEWHEREAYDMMGIRFDGHPDHRRILCPEDWVGYPLRKDYEFPMEYHGIPATTEYDVPNPVH